MQVDRPQLWPQLGFAFSLDDLAEADLPLMALDGAKVKAVT